MRKLKLDMESLVVESFAATTAPAEPVGTVRGAATNYANPSECDPSYCVAASCDWTHCDNLSCQAAGCGGGGGGGGATGGMVDTCAVHLCPPEVE